MNRLSKFFLNKSKLFVDRRLKLPINTGFTGAVVLLPIAGYTMQSRYEEQLRYKDPTSNSYYGQFDNPFRISKIPDNIRNNINSKEAFIAMHESITKLGLWEFLSTYDKNNTTELSRANIYKIYNHELNRNQGHSGNSESFFLQHMILIAQVGFNAYRDQVNESINEKKRLKKLYSLN
jgi:hypothetical protein